MKKLLIIILLLCTGCKNSSQINTLINKTNDNIISINYPSFEYTKINKIINNDINNIIDNFKNNNYNELNIDYKINEFEDYLNILLIISLDNKEYYKSYFYDIKGNKILNIKNVINSTLQIKNDLLKHNIKINNIDKYIEQLNFYIDNELIIFFNNYKYKYELKNLKIKLNKKNTVLKANNIINYSKTYDLSKKYIAITFDDGPSIYTNQIIDTLKNNNVCATFFILGNKVNFYRDTIIKSINNCNEIGNHSYNHKLLTKLSKQEIIEQIDKTNEEIKKYTGYTPTLLRPTYGSINNNIKESNMDIVLWTVDTMDWKYKNVNKIYLRATKNLKDGDIILMHDIYKTSALALDKIIKEIKKQDFILVTVSDLKKIEMLRKNE